MTCSIKAPQRYCLAPTEVRVFNVDMTYLLREGETITGTPTVVAAPTGPTIASIAINVAALDILDETAAIGKAISFKLSGQTTATAYTLTITFATSAGQTIVTQVAVEVT